MKTIYLLAAATVAAMGAAGTAAGAAAPIRNTSYFWCEASTPASGQRGTAYYFSGVNARSYDDYRSAVGDEESNFRARVAARIGRPVGATCHSASSYSSAERDRNDFAATVRSRGWSATFL